MHRFLDFCNSVLKRDRERERGEREEREMSFSQKISLKQII